MIEKYPTQVEHQMYTFYSNLKEREQRHYAALEALKLGHGGKKYITGLLNIHQKTLKRAAAIPIDTMLLRKNYKPSQKK